MHLLSTTIFEVTFLQFVEGICTYVYIYGTTILCETSVSSTTEYSVSSTMWMAASCSATL